MQNSISSNDEEMEILITFIIGVVSIPICYYLCSQKHSVGLGMDDSLTWSPDTLGWSLFVILSISYCSGYYLYTLYIETTISLSYFNPKVFGSINLLVTSLIVAYVTLKSGLQDMIDEASFYVGSKVDVNKIILKNRPKGIFNKSSVTMKSEVLNVSYESLEADDVVVETIYLSVDAFIRTMLDEKAYHGAIKLNQTLPAIGIGRVVRSGSNNSHKPGTLVAGMLGAQTYVILKSKEVFSMMQLPGTTLTMSLGLMGLTTGLTAWIGCFAVATPPKTGQVAVVSAAAGAVGSVAVQLLKLTGAQVIGVAGGKEKCSYLIDELNCDGAIDYKCDIQSTEEQFEALCPNGIDFFYDNVGGSLLDVVLSKLNNQARVIICGAVSQYSGNLNQKPSRVQGPSEYLKLAEKGASMHGFNVTQYMRHVPRAMLSLLYHHWRGHVSLKEHIEDGLETFPDAMEKMFTGGHVGKLLVKVKDLPLPESESP